MSSNLSRYEKTYAYKDLIKHHNLAETGTWEILGEDRNCDFGGHHSQARLSIVNGTLLEVLNFAVDMDGFWTWGAGGNIFKLNVNTVSDIARKISLQKEKETLLSRIKEIEKEMTQNR